MTTPTLHRFTRNTDGRGWFSCTWRDAEHGVTFVEDNHSFSAKAGTIRGLHWQEPQQVKLVRVIRGAILDVVVNLATGSVLRFELSAAEAASLYVPAGYAHGFCTLEDDTEVLYKVSERYAPGAQYGINPFDPALAIAWPYSSSSATMSEKDRAAPMFAQRHAT